MFTLARRSRFSLLICICLRISAASILADNGAHSRTSNKSEECGLLAEQMPLRETVMIMPPAFEMRVHCPVRLAALAAKAEVEASIQVSRELEALS